MTRKRVKGRRGVYIENEGDGESETRYTFILVQRERGRKGMYH